MTSLLIRNKADFNPVTHEIRIAALEEKGSIAIQVPAISNATTDIVIVDGVDGHGIKWFKSSSGVPDSSTDKRTVTRDARSNINGYSGNVGAIDNDAWGDGTNANYRIKGFYCDTGDKSWHLNCSTSNVKWNESTTIYVQSPAGYFLEPLMLTWVGGQYESLSDGNALAWYNTIRSIPTWDNLVFTVTKSNAATDVLQVACRGETKDFALEVSGAGIKHLGKKVLLEGDVVAGVADAINITKIEMQLNETTNLLADERRKVKALQDQLNVINSRLGITSNPPAL